MKVVTPICGNTVVIAYQAENNRTQVRFDLSDIMHEFPGGTAALVIRRHGDTDPVPAASVVMDGTALVWTVNAWECAKKGFLHAQVIYSAGDTVAKTKIYRFDVADSITATAEEPDGWQDWVGQLMEAAAEVVEAVESYDEITAEATGLAAGESPTAEIDRTGDNPVLKLGIPAGATGAKGDKGDKGDQGDPGPAGSDGAQGPKGDKGDTGATGAQGPKGDKGDTGATGAQGPKGDKGDKGDTGSQGPAGPKGDKGDPGDPGDLIDDEAGAGDTDVTFSADKLTAMDSELKNQINVLDNSKAPIIIDSASGAIATFPDGADGLPLESLVVDIEPVQSGTGDPSPENIRPISGFTGVNVARTGKNLCQGFERYNLTNYVSKPVLLKAGVAYKISCEADTIPSAIYLRKGSIAAESEQYKYNSKGWSFTPLETRIYLFQFYRAGSTGWDEFSFSNVQLEYGSEASSYEPYDGDTYQVVFPAAGKNLLNRGIEVYTSDNLYFGGDGTSLVPDGSLFLPAGTYTVSVSSSVSGIYVYDETGTRIAVKYNNTSLSFTISTDQKVLIRFSNSSTSKAQFDAMDMQCEKGSSATAYEEFTNTFYGGELDAVNGKLTVTHRFVTLDGVTIKCTVGYGNSGPNYYPAYSLGTGVDKAVASGNRVISSYLKPVNYASSQNSIAVGNSGQVMAVHIGTIQGTDGTYGYNSAQEVIAAANAYLAEHNLQICYELNEPLEFDLDPVTINTLLGYNAIFADTGDVAVDYRADTKLWIDGHSGSSITVDSALSSTSENPVQNKVINTALNGKEPKHNTTTVSGTTPSITAKAGVRYICGECSTLTIVVPSSGCIDVTFTSGSTATVLTVTPPTGMTMKWANGFDPSSLDANTTYEINIMDGCLGVVGQWT